jgi:transitional endoplasmic reticulum ATPase
MRRRRRLPQGLGPEAGAASDMARQQLGWYVRNCARSPARGMLERVMLERLDRLKGNLDGASEDFAFDDDASFDAAGLSRRRQEFRRILKDYAAMLLNDDSTELNALFARDEFGLDDIDTGILLLLLRYERNDDLEQFADEVLHRLHGPSGAVASLLGIDRREARRRLAADGALIESGLICLNQDGCSAGLAGQSGYLQLARPLRKVMYNPYDSRQEWSAALVGLPLTTPLDWEDFEHLGAAREMAAKVIAGAGKARASGVNLLVHGPVGTGKTEFAKALAAHDGISIWSVGETDDEGAEPTRAERLAALKLAQRLLAKRGGALILLDEAEDVLASEMAFLGPFAGRGRDRSKVYLNRLVEQNPVPIVWTCNDVAAIDPAVLRRRCGRASGDGCWTRLD